jgi:hypothetical protein
VALLNHCNPRSIELQQVDELIKKTEADYAQEQTTQREKNQAGLQKALAELGEFKSAPRDRFEKTKEYEQRVVREKAEYAAQQEKIRTSWQQAWKQLAQQIAEARYTKPGSLAETAYRFVKSRI